MIVWNRAWRGMRGRCVPVHSQRWISFSALERCLSKPVQSYILTSRDPYLNLAIEHHLFQKSSGDSVVLLLYINRPSIIIGRNQNPWLEVNLALLNQAQDPADTESPVVGAIDLVRRRSGGGTVFHDEGNVNWTIICPSPKFTRDRHAEMVVRALRGCGVDRARVNERHDIVLDQGERIANSDPEDTHTTPYTNNDDEALRPLKVSGSAYKLTRNRALHHGTCLLSSPNLNIIPGYLHSPAKPFMTARGVESVSSPVGNVLVSNEDFMEAVQRAFAKDYTGDHLLQTEEVGLEVLEIESIKKGYDELKSRGWTYLQTPQFTLSNASDEIARVGLELLVRHGVITGGYISLRNQTESTASEQTPNSSLIGRRLDEVDSWESVIGSGPHSFESGDRLYAVNWLQRMLPPTSKPV